MNVCVYTLGCRLNQCESEAIGDSFVREGFSVVSEDKDASLYIVNTCTVTSKAEQKARRMIRLFSKKADAVVVTGCYAGMNAEEIKALGDNVTVVPLVKKASLLELASHVKTSLMAGHSLPESVESFADHDASPFSYRAESFSYHSRSYLKIQEGCDNECAYCRVHVARGRSQFLERPEVIRRALELENAGFSEIVLTGVNLTMYDHEGEGLGGMLLELLPQLKQSTRIRLSSMEPDHIDEKLIEACADVRMHPHFHIPLQSASDRVLKRVNRKYSASHLEWVIRELRRVKDDPFIACDVITGLPSETDEDFEITRRFLVDEGFAALHVFPFSPRPDTPLSNPRDRVEERVRDERAAVLRTLSSRLTESYISRQIGKRGEVLLENRKDGAFYGTTGNYLKVRIENVPAFARLGQLFEGRLKAKGVFELD
ncbi:MAG: tRNA (N(6)-L-threonylcarbamoyladenosine(37)-C(2))-methylthiotransferase MtaB [Bullifex sp.]